MKFRLKMTLCMLGLLSVLFGAGGSLLIALSFHTSLEREQEAAHNAYQMILGTLQIVGSVNGKLDHSDISGTMEQLTDQNTNNWSALQLYTADSAVYTYNTHGIPASDLLPSPGGCTIWYALSGQDGHRLVLSGAFEAGETTFYLDMARDISPLFEMRQVQQKIFQWVFLMLEVLCAVLSYSLSRMLTAPLVKLSEASRSIAAGRLKSRVCISSRDEIGLVASDFNLMAEALEDKISQLRDAAERQERFMGSFAHEVKTPMTSIIGYADLIRGQTLDAQEESQAANYIVAEGKRLENLSQKLLSLLVLKKEPLSFSSLSPAVIIKGLADHLEPIYQKQGIEIHCVCEDGVCLLEPDLLKSLLVNLWDNARKAMDGMSGSICVYSKMLSDGCRITVRDSGRGIHEDALEHLTEDFYRVDKSRARAQGGVGLGLSLCREIVLLHHGSMHFESQVGQGTTVIVELRGGVL